MSQVSRFYNLNQPIESLVGNDGIVVPPFYDGTRWDVFVLGAGHINTTGSIALNTITINLDGGIADTYPTDAGVANPINYILEVFGGSNINTAAPLVPGNRIVINLNDNVHITGTFTADSDITSTAGNISATAGQVNAGTTMTAGTGITATTGNIVATAGQVNAGTTMTAGTGITSTTGNIVATAGQVNAGTTMTAGTGITSTTGNIVATAGQVNAGTTMTAGTGITATTGNITATAGNVVITAGNLTLPNSDGTGTQGRIQFGGQRLISNFGADNLFVGSLSGNSVLTGVSNVCLGSSSGIDLATGSNNACCGYHSGLALTDGSNNSLLGTGSGRGITTGSFNLLLGSTAGSVYTTESSNICLGNTGNILDANTIRIGTPGAAPGQQNKNYTVGIRLVAQDLTDAGIVTITSNHQLGSTGAMTDGQILIGSTGLNPSLGTITAGTGIAVINGAASITVDCIGGGTSWATYNANVIAVAGHGYMTNLAGRVDIALPAVSAVGDCFKVINISATAVGWRITQGATQTIYIGNTSSTIGAGGYLEATAIGDAIELVCSIANTEWIAVSAPQGNITIV